MFGALERGDSDALRRMDPKFIKVRDFLNGMPPLHWALKHKCHFDAVAALIDRGVELEHEYIRQTALDKVVRWLHDEDDIPRDHNNLSIFRSLLRAGASADNSYMWCNEQHVTRDLIAGHPQLRRAFDEVQAETDSIAHRVSTCFPEETAHLTHLVVSKYLGRPPSAEWKPSPK
jgi:hypothetical protein